MLTQREVLSASCFHGPSQDLIIPGSQPPTSQLIFSLYQRVRKVSQVPASLSPSQISPTPTSIQSPRAPNRQKAKTFHLPIILDNSKPDCGHCARFESLSPGIVVPSLHPLPTSIQAPLAPSDHKRLKMSLKSLTTRIHSSPNLLKCSAQRKDAHNAANTALFLFKRTFVERPCLWSVPA